MKRVAVALMVLLPLAGCGGSSSSDRAKTITPGAGSTSATASAPAAAGKALTAAQLKAALITVADLPTGYKVDPDPSDDDNSKTTSDNPECQKRFEALDAKDSTAPSAEADFVGTSAGSVLQTKLIAASSEAEAKKKLSDFAVLLSDCPKLTLNDEDGKTEVTFSALSFPNLGDETLALGAEIKNAGFEAQGNYVISRVGQHVALILEGGLSTDIKALESAARAQVGKLVTAVG